MTSENTLDETNDETQDVVRRHNRILRRITKILRRRIVHGAAYTDEVFTALCETNPAAEQAMRELWGSGEFDCGPQDYEFLVKHSIYAVRKLNEIEGHTNPQPDAAV